MNAKHRGFERRGFTLIEMLVAMALTLFVMVIISQAFVTALETFSGLKGIGDLQGNLRVASTLLRSDLALDHFDGKKKLSDGNITIDPPREGFFALRLGRSASEGTDADGMPCYRGPMAPLGANKADALYFTVKLRGNRRESHFTHRFPATPNPAPANPPSFAVFAGPPVPFFGLSPLTDVQYPRQGTPPPANPIGLPNFFNHAPDAIFQDDAQQLTYRSQWAEVVWYLVPTGTTVEPTNPASTLGTPLYSLYRAQYLLVPNNAAANQNYDPKDSTGAAVKPPFYQTLQETTHVKYGAAYAGISCYPNAALPPPFTNQYIYFNSPGDVTTSVNRTIDRRGETLDTVAANSALVLGNVVSFHARWMPVGGGGFTGEHSTTYPNNSALVTKTVDSAKVISGSISGATATSPIVITSANHNLPTGAVVTVAGVGGNTAANGIFTVVNINANSFALAGSNGNGNYSGGGTWTVNSIRALQIIIRAWDQSSQQSRQVTIVVDM